MVAVAVHQCQHQPVHVHRIDIYHCCSTQTCRVLPRKILRRSGCGLGGVCNHINEGALGWGEYLLIHLSRDG